MFELGPYVEVGKAEGVGVGDGNATLGAADVEGDVTTLGFGTALEQPARTQMTATAAGAAILCMSRQRI